MYDTMVEYGGIGIAAPQVHESLRLALIELEDASGEATLYTVVNPVTTVLDPAPIGNWEGCLSVPDMRGWVERPSRVRIDYLDEMAEHRTIEPEGFLATVFQHELDHLDGVLYVDRLSDPTRFAFMQEFTRYHLGPDEPDCI